jgi:hypothetical protein
MKEINFQYKKTPSEVTLRKAFVLQQPTNNYFTLDTTELNFEEQKELEEGLQMLQQNIDEAFASRTAWVKEHGFGSYYRSFNQEKMSIFRD